MSHMERDAALNARRALVEAVALLAAPADAQAAWLSSIGTSPSADELALEFGDWYQLLGQLEALGLVSSSAVSSSDALSHALAELPEGSWDESALARHPMWAQIRHFAGLALVELVTSSPEPRATYVRAAS